MEIFLFFYFLVIIHFFLYLASFQTIQSLVLITEHICLHHWLSHSDIAFQEHPYDFQHSLSKGWWLLPSMAMFSLVCWSAHWGYLFFNNLNLEPVLPSLVFHPQQGIIQWSKCTLDLTLLWSLTTVHTLQAFKFFPQVIRNSHKD